MVMRMTELFKFAESTPKSEKQRTSDSELFPFVSAEESEADRLKRAHKEPLLPRRVFAEIARESAAVTGFEFRDPYHLIPEKLAIHQALQALGGISDMPESPSTSED